MSAFTRFRVWNSHQPVLLALRPRCGAPDVWRFNQIS